MSQHGTARTRFDWTVLCRCSHVSDYCLGLAVLSYNVVRESKRTTIRLTSLYFFQGLKSLLEGCASESDTLVVIQYLVVLLFNVILEIPW
jgi:hypothetical protein